MFLVTILGIILGAHSGLRNDVLHSALSQFPIVGNDLASNIRSLHWAGGIGLSIGLIGMIWGSLGLASTGVFTMEQVWNLPGTVRPNCPKRLLRGLQLLVVLATGTILTTFLDTISVATRGAFETAGAVVGTLIISCLQFVWGFRVLTPAVIALRKLIVGALVAGVGWTVLQEFGSVIVDHYLLNDSPVYDCSPSSSVCSPGSTCCPS